MSYICSLSLSLLVGIVIELYATRNVYFSCVLLIRRVEAGERKLKALERAMVGGVAEKKALQSRTTITNDTELSFGPKPRGRGGTE